MIVPRVVQSRVAGYAAAATATIDLFDTTTEQYCHDQLRSNVRITRNYLEAIARRTRSRTILDVGCGVGTTVLTLLEDEFDAYGVDVAPLTRFWARLECPRERFFVVDGDRFELPFETGTFDLAVSIGVLEHVGTVDGHARRAKDCHARRRQWLREIYRIVKPSGHLLMGGPNRNFPVDLSHGLDPEASGLERWLSRLAGGSIHKTWGEYFLWGYADFARYLTGLEFEIEALRLRGLLEYSRAPRVLRPLARCYVNYLPRALLGTGFNPWVMALIKKPPSVAGATR